MNCYSFVFKKLIEDCISKDMIKIQLVNISLYILLIILISKKASNIEFEVW